MIPYAEILLVSQILSLSQVETWEIPDNNAPVGSGREWVTEANFNIDTPANLAITTAGRRYGVPVLEGRRNRDSLE